MFLYGGCVTELVVFSCLGLGVTIYLVYKKKTGGLLTLNYFERFETSHLVQGLQSQTWLEFCC